MKSSLLDTLRPFGQDHLLTFWDSLSDVERQSLKTQIEAIDFPQLAQLFEHRNDPPEALALADRATDPPAYRFSTVTDATPPYSPGKAKVEISAKDAIVAGKAALCKGKVGAILVAGGQGTRLGFPHPKGMYQIGPVSGSTLFQIHFEKVLAASKRSDHKIPYCIMTSPATHDETVVFLEEHRYFCLDKDDVFIFCQGTMPAVDMQDGKILLDEKGSIARSPDGHGGMLAALARRSEENASVLEKLKERRIDYMFYCQVDNPLVQICSPEFLGYHILSGSELTSQVIRKRFPTDRVGNVVDVDGKLHVIEYSDLPDAVARRTNADGSLQIWAGSIAVHAFSISLLERAANEKNSLPFHTARKKVPFVDLQSGERRKPEKENAIKFERFIFDLLPSANNAVVVEVDIPNHYGPLKNASGSPSDSPETVQRDISALYRSWLQSAGAEVNTNVPMEISPLYADSPKALREKIKSGSVFDRATYLR